MLEGDVSKSWLTGENSQIVPTETQKNTCYALALKTDFDAIEDYGVQPWRGWCQGVTATCELSGSKYRSDLAVSPCSCPARCRLRRIRPRQPYRGRWHSDTTMLSCRAHLHQTNLPPGCSPRAAGLRDLGSHGVKLMKTTQSGFDGFIRDEYTNLQPTGAGTASPDRILCTELVAEWTYRAGGAPEGKFRAENAKAWQAMLNCWAGPPGEGIFSPSLQRTTTGWPRRRSPSAQPWKKSTSSRPTFTSTRTRCSNLA